MARSWMIPVALGVNIGLTVAAQSLLRHGMMSVRLPDRWGGPELARLGWTVLRTPSIELGLALFVGSLLLWLYLLARVPLGLLYPVQQGLVFLGIQLTVWRWLGESPGPGRWAGILLILLGVLLVSRSG